MRRSASPAVRLPDPYIPEYPWTEISAMGSFSSISDGTLVASNNDAHFVPVIFPCAATVYSISFAATNGTGNYDIGLYDNTLARIVSSGSTAMSAAGVKTLSCNVRVEAGLTYWAALAFSSTSGQTMRPLYSATLPLRTMLWGFQASALPLPSTATPVTTTAYQVAPILAFGVR